MTRAFLHSHAGILQPFKLKNVFYVILPCAFLLLGIVFVMDLFEVLPCSIPEDFGQVVTITGARPKHNNKAKL